MLPALLSLLLGGLFAASGRGGDDDGGTSDGLPSTAPAVPPTTGSTGPTTSGDDDDDDGGLFSMIPQTPTAPAPSIPNAPAAQDPVDPPDQPDAAYALGWGGLSEEEQLIVELVNRARLDPLGEVARQGEGFAAGVTAAPKEALAVVESLSEASRDHSEDMDNRDFFAHTNPSGESPADRAIDADHGSRFVGENIGWVGSSNTNFDAQSRVEQHHAGLWESDGHQQNLMSNNWSEIGVGYDYGDYRGFQGSTFTTEMFGDRGDTYLTGVVIEDRDGDNFYDIGEGQGDVRVTAEAADGTVYTTSTWDAGGYSLELPPGTYQVTFHGGDMDVPYQTTVTIGSENVKLDAIDPGAGAALTLNATAAPAPATVPAADDSAFLPLIPMPEDAAADATFTEHEDEEPADLIFL